MASYGHGLSLLTGWLPPALQVVTALVLLAVVLRRAPRRWYLLWLPAAAVAGAGVALLVRSRLTADGLTDDPAPLALWIWVAVAAAATLVAIAGWPDARWWRRCLAMLAVPLTLLCVASTLNRWVGYFPTVQEAWAVATAGPMPDQVTDAQLAAMTAAPTRPVNGALVGVANGGDAALWARVDPLTVLAGHAPYPDTAGWFANATGGAGTGQRTGHPPTAHRTGAGGTGFGGQADGRDSGNQNQEATQLCTAMTTDRIACTLHTVPGGHTWQVAAASFADAFPWVVSRIDGPPVPPS